MLHILKTPIEVSHYQMLIGGQWKDAAGGKGIERLSPAHSVLMPTLPSRPQQRPFAALPRRQSRTGNALGCCCKSPTRSGRINRQNQNDPPLAKSPESGIYFQ